MGRRKVKDEAVFKRVYYSTQNPGSLSGLKRFKDRLNSKKKHYKSSSISEWLQSQESYTRHKPVIRKFKRRVTLVSGINDQFQCDLIDMQKFKKVNDNFAYILSVIDVFSKYAWAKPLKSKGGKEVAEQLRNVIKEQKCRSIQSDKGKEFFNSHVQKLFKDTNIHHFTTENDDIKAACVERFNRTLKTSIFRWFTKKRSTQWINELGNIVHAYNHSIHSTTLSRPADVSSANEEDVWLRIYSQLPLPSKRSPLNNEDVVRISKYKHVFSKGYDANWSRETFVIDDVLPTVPITLSSP